MGLAYKNFWSLNTDEAVVTGILRDFFSKDESVEIFLPLNAQMKGIDLVIANMQNRSLKTIQIKGSKAYEPRKSDTKKYGDGSGGWFFFPIEVVEKATADYFIFLVYVLSNNGDGRREIEQHTITLPTNKLKELCKKNKSPHAVKGNSKGRYSFYFWVNPKTKKAFDFRDTLYDVSEYLDNKGFENIIKK